jgi:hypothetical protein
VAVLGRAVRPAAVCGQLNATARHSRAGECSRITGFLSCLQNPSCERTKGENIYTKKFMDSSTPLLDTAEQVNFLVLQFFHVRKILHLSEIKG